MDQIIRHRVTHHEMGTSRGGGICAQRGRAHQQGVRGFHGPEIGVRGVQHDSGVFVPQAQAGDMRGQRRLVKNEIVNIVEDGKTKTSGFGIKIGTVFRHGDAVEECAVRQLQGLSGTFLVAPVAQNWIPAQAAQLRDPPGHAVMHALRDAHFRDEGAGARAGFCRTLSPGFFQPPDDIAELPDRLAGRIESEVGQTRRQMPALEKASQLRMVILAVGKGIPHFFTQRLFCHMSPLTSAPDSRVRYGKRIGHARCGIRSGRGWRRFRPGSA